jgi:hypothetical protein
MTHYKFVSWDVPAFETILTGRIPAALLAADNGNLQPLKDLHIATQTPVGVFLLRNICAAFG